VGGQPNVETTTTTGMRDDNRTYRDLHNDIRRQRRPVDVSIWTVSYRRQSPHALLRARDAHSTGEAFPGIAASAGGRWKRRRKELFFARIWPHDHSDANLTQHIFLLRSLLGETSRDHSYIVTVPGKGYRLAAVVERKVGLAMKSTCESCGTALDADGDAYICSYECTFCPHCFAGGNEHCPNCGGEQVQRPRRLHTNSSTHRAHSD
jgi:uncharacterized protein